VIAAARRVAVLTAGMAKAPVVARVLRGPWRPEVLPAQLAREGTWILDRAAASALPS
jgi:6-phosphogluconolactonase/glucosamine-6-phosphate isomerase/deaminase